MARVIVGYAPALSDCLSLCGGQIESFSATRRSRIERSGNDAKCVGLERSTLLGERDRKWQAGSARSWRNQHQHGLASVRVDRLKCRASVEELLHNQVLVSSSLAGILGQFAKPFTYALFGRGFDWKLTLKPGGMPSTHSASVTAAATALGMERGLSDSLFGLSVVLACLVMYDAQGVRRSVGKQAEVLNTIVYTRMVSLVSPESASATPTPYPAPARDAIGVELARDPVQAELAFMEEADGAAPAPNFTAVLDKDSSLPANGNSSPRTPLAGEKSQPYPAGLNISLVDTKDLPSVKDGQVSLQEIASKLDGWKHLPLKETVGHTKVEVLVGAVWGIVVAVAFHSIKL